LEFDLELDLLTEEQCNGVQGRQLKVRLSVRLVLNHVKYSSCSISS